MRFSFSQPVAVAPDAALAAYADPAFYEHREQTGDIALVGVVGHQADGPREWIEVRYRFVGNVSSAVRAVIDPAKMSWVTRTDIHRAERRTTFTVVPDHYADRLEAHGSFVYRPDPPSSSPETATAADVVIEGDLAVRAFLVARTVERSIVSGLRTYLTAEVLTLPRFSSAG